MFLIGCMAVIAVCLFLLYLLSKSDKSDPVEIVVYDHKVLPHCLFFGPAGTGKTTLANCCAGDLSRLYGHEIGFHVYTPATLDTVNKIRAMLSRIDYGDVVFIDEIHGFELSIEETLYSVLQDFYFSDNGNIIRVPKFTMIGATTLAGKLSDPLRDRFPINIELRPASQEDLAQILINQQKGIKEPTHLIEYVGQEHAKQLLRIHLLSLLRNNGDELSQEVVWLISQRALGNPRMVKQIAKHVRAFQSVNKSTLTAKETNPILSLLGIDENGLHENDRRVIRALISRNNKPSGVNALAAMAGVAKTDLEQIIEPRLEYCGYLTRTPSGRKLSDSCLVDYGASQLIVEGV